jgi:hypothetical protein
MNKDEALRLALEALEIPWNAPYVDGCDLALGKKVKAITAIKEALAQPEQEPCCYGGIAHDCHAGEGCRIVNRMKATQPQRTWVELDEEDYIKALELADFDKDAAFEFFEAKLKEKNNG